MLLPHYMTQNRCCLRHITTLCIISTEKFSRKILSVSSYFILLQRVHVFFRHQCCVWIITFACEGSQKSFIWFKIYLQEHQLKSNTTNAKSYLLQKKNRLNTTNIWRKQTRSNTNHRWCVFNCYNTRRWSDCSSQRVVLHRI